MRILYLILILLNSSLLFSNNTDKIIILNDSLSQISLDEYTYLYSTKDTSSNIHAILNNKFEYKAKGLNVGVNDKIHWIKYHFVNPTEETKELYLYFPYNHINKIIVYELYEGNEAREIIKTGTYFSYDNKDFKSRTYPIKILLKPGITNYYIYVNHLYIPLRATSFLITKNVLIKETTKMEANLWFWKGFFSFSLIITLVLFLTTRVKSFLYYFFLNIGIGMFFSMEVGDFFVFFNQDASNTIIDIKHLGNIIVLIFSPLFINSLFPIAKLRPKVWKIMFILISLLPVLWIICLFPSIKSTFFLYYTTLYLILVSLIVFLLQIYFALIAYLNGHKNAIYLFIAYIFYIGSTIVTISLPNMGLRSNSIDVYNAFIYGSMFEIIVFMGLIGKETFSIYKQRSALLEKQKQHQTEIIKAIVESQEKERNAVGRELHDMIGGNISVIKQQVDKKNTALISIIDSTIESVRSLSHGLVTPLIKDDDFVSEINDLCIMFSSLDIKIESNFHNWTRIENEEKATHLYRIVQELLQNAIKHSSAKNVLIQFITNNENKLTVMYEDDGIGFDYIKSYNNKGLGLINIDNRIKLINASIVYDTQSGRKGTTIIMDIGK